MNIDEISTHTQEVLKKNVFKNGYEPITIFSRI